MLKQWYTVSNQDRSYCIDCVDVRAVKSAIQAAERSNLHMHELIVSEHEFDKTCEDNKSLIDFCNAEVFILDF